MTRILGGVSRGQGIQTPSSIRPTQAKVRGALFDIWGSKLVGCRFADLFAGSGAIGLEAISRCADHVLFVESNSNVLAFLKRNCERLAPADACQIVKARLPRLPAKVGTPVCDLVFADPPYTFESYPSLLLMVQPWLSEGGSVAIEHSRRSAFDPPEGWLCSDLRNYGDAALSFYQLVSR